MALRIITGVPGAGKTYYAVDHITKNYCDEVGGTFDLQDKSLIVTNIDGLLLDTVDLRDAIEKTGSFEKFFTIEIQEKIAEKYKKLGKSVVYIIDEAQQFFHRRFYDRGVFTFFETHRHLAMDIYLITQNVNLLAKDLISLAEYEIRAVPRTLSIAGFNYLKKSNKEIIGRSFLRRKKKVFLMYKSMMGAETEKIKSPYIKYLIPVIVLMLIGSYGLKNSFFGRSMGWSEVEVVNAAESKLSDVGKKSSSKLVVAKAEMSKVVNKQPFVRVSYAQINSQLRVFDLVTNDLVPSIFYPHELKTIKIGKTLQVYARLPDQIRKNIKSKIEN